jgi:protein-S-isoprenylcysteine O-methyltransferase Ste14
MGNVTMDYLVTAAGIITVGIYIWSLRGHFVSRTMPQGTRVISVAVAITTVFYILLVFSAEQPLWTQVAGFVLQLAAGVLFFAAIAASREARLEYVFTSEKPRGLVESGPYRHIRHPFYTSYIVFWSGWALATWSLYSLVPLAIFVVAYVIAARNEEQKFAETPMAASYAAYKQRAGLFWPKLIRG